jgi:hypothetical protein
MTRRVRLVDTTFESHVRGQRYEQRFSGHDDGVRANSGVPGHVGASSPRCGKPGSTTGGRMLLATGATTVECERTSPGPI